MAEEVAQLSSEKDAEQAPAESSKEMAEKIVYLEKKVESQDEEIVLLKAALSDALRRLQSLEVRKVNVGSGKSKRSASASDQTSSKSPSQTKKYENQKLGVSPNNSFISSPAKSSPRLHSGDQSFKKSHVRRKSSSSGLTKDEQVERDAANVKFQLRGRSLIVYSPTSFTGNDHSIVAPDKKLQLEWVYGYRGKDCRNNLYYLPSNEIVYNTAAVIVLYNPISKTQRHYTEHTDDVKCLALHPNKEIIGSGQVAGHAKKEGKPHVRIWNALTLQTLKVIGLGTFQRGLCCIAFSVQDDGQYIVAVDGANDHYLSVWDWDSKKKIAEAKAGNEAVLVVDFHPSDSKSMVSCGKAHIAFWKLSGDKKLEKKMGVFEKHPKPKYMLCFAFGHNGELITGDSNGNIYIWENGSNHISQTITTAHEGPIFSIEAYGDGMFLSGGGKDRKVYLWDSNYNKSEKHLEVPEESGAVRSAVWGPLVQDEKSVLVGTTKNCIVQASFDEKLDYLTKGHFEELWGLCPHPSRPVFVTCGYDKNLFLWNSEDKSLIWNKVLADPLQSVCFHPNGNLLAVATQNNKWLILDSNTGEEFYSCEVGAEQHDCIKYSPDGKYLAVGSHDNFIYIFTVSEDGKQYKKHGKLMGHSSYVTHLDWSKDSQFLQSNSGDYEILYWQSKDCHQVSSAYSMRDVEWDTWTCVLGFPVRGMWPEGADGTDINACSRSNSAQYLANGDDSGAVNLFKYPCPKPKSVPNVARGHSSHVTGVCFLATDSHVISTGGKDNSVMQWRVQNQS